MWSGNDLDDGDGRINGPPSSSWGGILEPTPTPGSDNLPETITHVVLITNQYYREKFSRGDDPPLDFSRLKNALTFELLHETSHQIGAPDHYCYDKSVYPDGKCGNDYCWDHARKLNDMPVCLMTNTYMLDIETRDSQTIYCAECTGPGSLIAPSIPEHLVSRNYHHY